MSDKEKLQKFPIYLNAFEAGILTPVIYQSGQKHYLENVFKQLMEVAKEIRKLAGVTVEYLGDGKVKMIDKDGNTITREMYPWEKSGEYE